MDPLQLSGPRATHIKALSDKLNSVKSMLDNTKAGLPDGSPVVPELVQALTNELQSLEAEFHREIMAATGGESGAVLGKGESMRDAVDDGGTNVTLGQIIRGRGFGKWDGVAADVRAQILSDGPGGSIPGPVVGSIVDLARQGSVVFGGGAKLMPIAAPTAKVARMTSAPTAQWKPESAERTLDDQEFVFDSAELAAQTAWFYATISIEASEDVLDLDQAIMNHFAQQLALTFDEAGLVGTGIDQPVGLCNMGTAEDRIIEQNAVGEIADHRPFVRAMGAVKAAHHEPSSVILTPGLWTEINCLQDGDNNPLVAPRAYQKLNEAVSDFLPADGGVGTDEHTAIVGDLSAMTFGVKTGSQLEISRLGDGFAKGSIALRGYVRFGWYLTRPEAICVMRGITLPAAI